MIAFEKYAQVSVTEKNIGDTKLQLKTKISVVKRGEHNVVIRKTLTKIIVEAGEQTTFNETIFKNPSGEDTITSIDGANEDIDSFNKYWDEKWNVDEVDERCVLNQDNEIDQCEILNGNEKE